MNTREILVSGASGFVGRHLVTLLVGRGVQVHGLGPEPSPPWFTGTRWHVADVLDGPAIVRSIGSARPSAIVHLAGQASAGRSFEAAVETFRVNVLGTSNVVEAALQVAPKARLLVVGSGESYGPQPPGSQVPETAEFHPVSPYALSKAVADRIGLAFATKHGLDLIRTRSFSHGGPGQTVRFALPSFATQIARIERTGRGGVLRVGNLDVIRDMLDVRDVAECYVALLERGESGEAYNVCSGVGVPLREVVETMIGLARVPIRIEVDSERVRPADVPYLVGDPQKVRARTGWNQHRRLEQTLHDLLEHCRRAAAEV